MTHLTCMNSLRHKALMVLLTLSSIIAAAQTDRYRTMDKIDNLTLGLGIRCITQDAEGTMWFGTDEGLYRYDGYELDCFTDSLQESARAMQTFLIDHDTIYIGCENGLLKFSLASRRFTHHDKEYANVRNIIKHDNRLYIASSKGLFQGRSRIKGIDDAFSLFPMDEHIYIGLRHGLRHLNVTDHKIRNINDEIFVVTNIVTNKHSAYGDDKSILAGSAKSLWTISHPTNNNLTRLKDYPVIKTICYDSDNNLVIGTDNGLYVTDQEGNTTHFTHDARNSGTISGDVVWCVFRDRDDNTWIGTNDGISLSPQKRTLHIHNLHHITGSGSGMVVNTILIDSRRTMWVGGTHGIIRIDSINHSNYSHKWYNMNNSHYQIMHNRINGIIEDKYGRIWAAASGSILLYDTITQQFSPIIIKQDNNNWIHAISEEGDSSIVFSTPNANYYASVHEPLDGNNIRVVRTTPIAKHTRPSLQTLRIGKETWTLNKNTVTIQNDNKTVATKNITLPERHKTMHYDKATNTVWFGGSDKMTRTDLSALGSSFTTHKPLITKILINGRDIMGHDDITDRHICLKHNENNIQIHFSDFNYNRDKTMRYMFRIPGMQNRWFALSPNQNTIQLFDLNPGKYELFLAPLDSINANGWTPDKLITIKVEPHILLSTPAFILYILFAIAITFAIRGYFKQRKLMKYEKRRREQIIQNAKMKEQKLISDKESLQNQLRIHLMDSATKDGNKKDQLSQDDLLLIEITRIIEENISNPDFSVNNLSELTGISSKQLYRKIKQLTGMTTVAYIRALRMKKATSLLANPHFTIAEAMYRVGFSNASYFTRCFQSDFGMTPTDYKAQHSGDS